jgi:hypothetical protein
MGTPCTTAKQPPSFPRCFLFLEHKKKKGAMEKRKTKNEVESRAVTSSMEMPPTM